MIIVLKDENRPTQIEDIDYAETVFYLHIRLATKPLQRMRDDPLLKKQMEILSEIIDSEIKYVEDLKLIQTGFLEPVMTSGCLESCDMNDIFLNVEELISIHESVLSDIAIPQLSFKKKLSDLICSFMTAVIDIIRLTLGSTIRLL